MYSRETLNEILGCAASRDSNTPGLLDYHELILKGFPWEIASHAMNALSIPDDSMALLLGMSPIALDKLKKSRSRLAPMASDRLFRFARIAATATYVLEDLESAISWLSRPQIGLGGRVPLEFIRTDSGTVEVEKLLGRIEYSVLS